MMRRKLFLAFVMFFGSLVLLTLVEADVSQIDTYKKAIEKNPKDFLAHLELGRAYQKLGLYDNAIAEYKEAIRSVK